jgi:riboflavin-specific deaminase-like protein
MQSRTMNRPFVFAHFAITADGKISTHRRTPAQFTSASDKRRLQEVRAASDAILVGRGTLSADTMSMGLSAPDLRASRIARGCPPEPLRVIVSNAGRLKPDWKVFRRPAPPPIIFSTTRMPERVRTRLAAVADVFLFDRAEVDLLASLRILRSDFGVNRLVCEGGGELLRSLAALDLVDAIRLTVAPVVFGGFSAPTLTGAPGQFLIPQREFRIVRMAVVENECCLELRRAR